MLHRRYCCTLLYKQIASWSAISASRLIRLNASHLTSQKRSTQYQNLQASCTTSASAHHSLSTITAGEANLQKNRLKARFRCSLHLELVPASQCTMSMDFDERKKRTEFYSSIRIETVPSGLILWSNRSSGARTHPRAHAQFSLVFDIYSAVASAW